MNNNITIGMDLGDQNHLIVAMDADGKEIEMKTIHNTAMVDLFRDVNVNFVEL